MTAAILGKKLGMTSFYLKDGSHIPCTVVEAGPCPVVQLKTIEKDGYSAVKIGYGEIKEKALNRPMRGLFKNAKVKPRRMLKEFRNPKQEYKVGDELTVSQFNPGDKVKVIGTSKGRGFQGVMKRHNFGGVGMMSHGQSDRQRHPGSVGQSSYPSRIIKGVKMAGRMGGKKVTVRNIQIVEALPEQNLLIIKGSLPGPNNSFVEIVKQ